MTLKNIGKLIVFTKQEYSVMSDCVWPHKLQPTSLLFHGIFQARIFLEWVTISYSRIFSLPRDRTRISCIGRWILYHALTWEALYSFYSAEAYSWENSSIIRTPLDFFKTCYKFLFGFKLLPLLFILKVILFPLSPNKRKHKTKIHFF